MTSFRTIVNTTCVKFNKICQPYPRVNTGSELKTSHRGVDKSNGLHSQQPKIGWKTGPVFKQLGAVNRRPMGLTGSVRVHARAFPEALAEKASSRNTVFHRGAKEDLRGDQGVVSKRGHKGNNSHCRQLCLSNLSGGKEGRGAETGDKPEGSEFFCEDRAFQDGRSTHTASPHPEKRLDGKNGFEGCIPSDSNPPREPTPPPVSMGRQTLSIPVSPFRADLSPPSFLEGDETCGGNSQTYGNSSGDIPGRSFNTTSGEGGADSAHSFNFSTVRSPRTDCQSDKISINSTTENRIFRVSGRCNGTTSDISSREAEKNPTVGKPPPSPTKGIGERPGTVCGEGLCSHKSNMASPTTLQSTAVSDKLSGTTREPSRACNCEIQYQSEFNQGGRERPDLVDISGPQDTNAITNFASGSKHDDRVRCLQQGLGSPSGGPKHWGKVVSRGILTPHKLPGVTGSLPSSTEPCQTQSQNDNSVKDGQCHGSDIYQQARRHSLSCIVPIGIKDMGVEPTKGHIPDSRTSARDRECGSRSGITPDERSLRLDAKSSSVQPNTTGNGPSTNRLVCFSPDKAATNILQLETRPGGTGNGCVQSRLVSGEGICQPPMVPDCTLSEPNKETSSKSGNDHSTVGISTLVPNHSGDAGGVSQTSPSSGRPSDTSVRTGLHNEPGCANTSGMANLRESFTSQGISPEAADLLLASWRSKTKSNYDSLFAKWAGWCQSRHRDPTTGPVEDIVNFLAELYRDGYKYRSLNAYRSAISALHSKVDGQPIGQHPLITRMLKGVYNERPPLPRYSSFWDVGAVLKHIKKWGVNDNLSLRQLTLKLTMLMALTRPARTVDLSKLDISNRYFTASGVLFQPQHLSKQSRPSKPMADFFYPKYKEDETICPVVTLLAYEARTLEFRDLLTNKKTLLFLSWIGKHEPVTSSTIARWLKTCLSEAGINTDIFKAHSVRGASSSTAAAAGVTTSEILQAADWSSATTFQKFYLRVLPDAEDKTSFGTAVLSSSSSVKLTC